MITCYDRFAENAGKYALRYLAHNDYYSEKNAIDGRWMGALCEKVGVREGAKVDPKEFKRLSENRHAKTREQVTVRKNGTRIKEWMDRDTGKLKSEQVPNRKPICDVVIPVPKTFSCQGFLGRDERIYEWHRLCVDKVVKEMEMIGGRRLHNGVERLERTENIVAAIYDHNTSRSQEAHIHAHCVVFNMTQSKDGRKYALDFREFVDQSRYLTALYWDELTKHAREDGLDIVKGKYGQPEIAPLIEMASEHSTRSEELNVLFDKIEEHAGSKLTNVEASYIKRASRGMDMELFERLWEANKDELDALRGLDPVTAEGDRLDLLRKFTAIVTASNKDSKKVTTPEALAEQQQRVTRQQRFLMEQVKTRRASSLAKLPTIEESIDFAISHCFQNSTIVKGYELYQAILQHAQGLGVDPEEMKQKTALHPGLVWVGCEVTTLEHFQRELESILWVQEGKGKGISIPSKGLNAGLNPSQRKAVEGQLDCLDQFSALNGAAGVGKTSWVTVSIVEKNLAAGRRVAVVAPSDAARDVLKQEAAKLPPDSPVAAVLRATVSQQMFLSDPRLRKQLGPGDLLIVDEASRVSFKDGHATLKWATENGVRVWFVGDPDQDVSVEAGDFFRIMLKKSGIHTALLHDIKRQPPNALDGHYLEAIKLFKAGRSTAAFVELDKAGCIIELRGRDRVDAYVNAIIKSQDAGIPTIVTNASHRENAEISDAVRKKMFERGELRDEKLLKCHKSLGYTDAKKREIDKFIPEQILEIIRGKDKGRTWRILGVDKGQVRAVSNDGQVRVFTKANVGTFDVCEAYDLKVAIGDKLLTRAGSKSKKGNFINSEWLTVSGWDGEGNPVASDGRPITGRNLCYSYAATTPKVQGVSELAAICGFDRHAVKWATKKIAYTMLSRGRTSLLVFCESKADLSQIENHTGDRRSAVEMDMDRVRVPIDVKRKLEQVQKMTR